MKDKFKLISNMLFYIGVVISIYGFYKIWEVRAKLPDGVCPVDDNRGILILGIIILVSSILIDFIDTVLKKR